MTDIRINRSLHIW
ncbi:unnamed protein product [Acanthoscelides obtectus]|uniref:Uncharacterized protein n=1 Tax=Acanthoscelides obtectus TaxID=200917 RepID=A0A9P0KWZ8_ACAOB|nr:unnamed protein product [Acanthoscelides obtectus]CAK1619885.1 hypothetical protein AOBTE_LOCUS57 [Acanthoscelides obtectus]